MLNYRVNLENDKKKNVEMHIEYLTRVVNQYFLNEGSNFWQLRPTTKTQLSKLSVCKFSFKIASKLSNLFKSQIRFHGEFNIAFW